MKPSDSISLSIKLNYLSLQIVMLFVGALTPFSCFSQEGYTYKDREYKFEVYFPVKPGDITDKPVHQILCTQSVSKTYHVLIFSAKVKINRQTVQKTVYDQFAEFKNGGTYKIAGSSEFNSGGIDVIDFWGTIAGQNLTSRIFVFGDNVHQFSIYSNADDISKEISYPFFNSIKLSNGVVVKSPDHDAGLYSAYNFNRKQTPVAASQIPSSGNLTVDASTTKVALVIGIKTYEAVPPLSNTLNDARDIATALKSKGFSVIELFDPKTKAELRNAVIEFTKALRGKTNGVGMLYYSGHGMQVDGTNYIIPASATLEIKADIDEQCLNMDYVLRAMEENGNQLNIIILDACRNNPFRSFSRSADKGLSMVNAPKGSYIVYSTKPGSVASDGTGRNGLFTSKLLKFMAAPDISLEEVFKNVAAEVARDSNDQQRPWISSDYTGVFYFTPR